MRKKLTDMTLEELWQLFPIELKPHADRWANDYMEMEKALMESLHNFPIIRISHIGSTAVRIWAKPIVDILVEIANGCDREEAAKVIESMGFLPMSQSERRMSFNFGYTEDGFAEKVYHLHLRFAGDHDELYFRDYLNDHPEVAEEYENLKLRLWKQFKHNRDAYTDAKTEFITHYTKEAKKQYGNRYGFECTG